MNDDIYELEELIEILLNIKERQEGILINPPKACLTLALEIQEIRQRLDWIYDLIPLKYKKQFPKEGENPFFSKLDIKPTSQDYKAAKERMENLLKNNPMQDP